MVRALAGDSTMTRFLGTGGSVALGPYPTVVRPRGCGAGSPRRSRGRPRPRGPAAGSLGASSASADDVQRSVAPGDGTRRDLHEPDVEIREEEDRLDVVDEDRSLAVHHPQVRAAQPDVARRGRLVQVGEQRLLVVEMQDDVADHCPMVARAPGVVSPPMVRSGVVEVDHQADPTAGDPDADPDVAVGRVHHVPVVATVVRLLALEDEVRGEDGGLGDRPSGSRCSRPSGSPSSRRGEGGRPGHHR